MIVLTLPFYVGYALRSHYLIAHPEIEPYFARDWLVIMRNAIALLVGFWIVFLGLGWLERRFARRHTLYALVGTLSWWVGAAGIAYGLGPVTSPAWIAILVGVVWQLLLLPRALAGVGIAFGLCLVVASMTAVGVGAAPYAPMMSAAATVDGRIALPHLVGATTASVLATLALAGVVHYIVSQWRETHGHLADVNANLERSVAQRTSELMAAETQLRQVEKMEAIGRLAGGIAHDFNNLLAVITGYADLLLTRPGTDAHRRELGEIKTAGDHAARLVRQLLAVGRRQLLKPEPLRLDSVVLETLEMLRPLVGEDVEIRLQLAAELGQVEADRVQMEQVVLNLAANARDAMPRGGTLTIETANVDLEETTRVGASAVPEGAWVMLGISDTGSGMDAELRERAFEPFFTTKPQGKGTGLGLATVYGIVDQSGGGISLETGQGKGTTIRIYLPSTTAKESPRIAEIAHTRKDVGTEKVLLVEDNDAVRDLAAKALRRRGYTVYEARDAEAAVQWIQSAGIRPHLLLTDVVMPGISGPNLAARLLRLNPELRIVYMSGYTDDAGAVQGNFWAGVPLLQKPFTPAALAEQVRVALDAPRGQA
jgi:signal transduction histidine kinase/ActR/RegA family two-component response regulator